MVRSAVHAGVAAAVLGVAVLLVPLVTAAPSHRRTRGAAVLAQLIARLLLRALRVRVQWRGTPTPGPCLVVANHVSWLDVLVLAAAAPMVPVAKAEVASWPVLGGLATRLGAVFVQRENLRELPGVVAEVTAALRRGHRVQVFPESTTGCGTALRPFHRAVFQAAVDAAAVISPVALSYRGGGSPAPPVAFVGEDDLLGSLWRILRSGPVTVRVRWLPPIPAAVGTEHPARSRALAARRAERAVAVALGQPVIGRRAAAGTRTGRPSVAPPSLQVA